MIVSFNDLYIALQYLNASELPESISLSRSSGFLVAKVVDPEKEDTYVRFIFDTIAHVVRLRVITRGVREDHMDADLGFSFNVWADVYISTCGSLKRALAHLCNSVKLLRKSYPEED